MTCSNEVLSITVVKRDSLINRVSLPEIPIILKLEDLSWGGGGLRGRSEGEQVVEEEVGGLSSF